MNFDIEGKSLNQTKRRNSTRETIFQSKIFNSEMKKKQSNNFGSQSYEDMKKKILELKKNLDQQIKKRENTEEQLKLWKSRTVTKQVQFRSIIAKYQKEKIVLDSNQLIDQHQKILKMIDEKAILDQKWLQKKYKQNLFLMEKRISQIKKKCEQQIQKHQKLSLQTYNEIMTEVQYTKTIAKSIDQENKKLHQQIKEIKLKYQLLFEERNILIRQVIQKNNSIKKNRYCKARSRQITQRLTTVKFMDSPTLKSPMRNSDHSFLYDQTSNQKRQFKLVDLLKRTISRQKKKNFELSQLFTKNSIKNRQLNQILWQCIQQTRNDMKLTENKVFHQALLQKVLKSQKLLKGINEIQKNPIQKNQNQKQINCSIQLLDFMAKSKQIGISQYPTQQF